MAQSAETTDEETEIFNLCSLPECPRDIRFECESLIDYNSDQSKSKTEKNLAMRDHVHRLLSSHFIENINKTHTSRKIKFRCTLCLGKPMGTIVDCLLHLTGSLHQKLELLDQVNYTVQHIPEPSEDHCVSVGRTIYQIVGRHVISDAEVRRRNLAVQMLNEDLKKSSIGSTISLYGSSLTGLGFQDSDTNISVCISESLSKPKAKPDEPLEDLQKFISFIQNHPRFVKMTTCSNSQAVLHLTKIGDDCDRGELILNLRIDYAVGVDTAKLFAKYVKLCPMVQPLVVAFRLWAKLYKVDCCGKEGLPPNAFVSMVIYFLQRENILPVLNPAVLSSDKSDEEVRSRTAAISPARLGYLWIKLLRFYSDEELYTTTVISISEEIQVTKEQRRWTDRKITIADPIDPTLNLTRKAMSNNRMCEYIVERIKYSYMYFGIPRTIRGGLYDGLMPSERKDICSPHVFHKFAPGLVSGISEREKETLLDKIDNPKWNPVGMAEEVRGVNWSSSLKFAMRLESVKVRLFIGHQDRVSVLADDAFLLEDIFPDWLYQYKFNQDIVGFGPAEEPPVSCKACNSKEHFRTECPMEVMPYTPPSSYEISMMSVSVLNEVLVKNYEKYKLTPNDMAIRESIMSSIKLAIARAFPDVSLQLFGSSVNGFGINLSDVDITVVFSDSLQANEKEEHSVLVTKMARIRNILYKMEEFNIIYFARNARVPVVKFLHVGTNLQGDLSASNYLAVHNSHLLRVYAEIDPRVKIIGCFLKKLVKLCEISEASKGSLSCYGYTLMVIYFFQQLSIPILPVLHELPHDKSGTGTTSTEGWSVEYFSDMENLKQVWPVLGNNHQSVGELWLSFLSFYTNFNYEDQVITVRQHKPLTRLSKFWLTDSLIAIEDPFQLSHNIGSHLSRKMSVHILKTFGKFYELFHRNYESSMLEDHKDWLAYFTDPAVIRDGKPPVDWHQCYVCHHIGHKGADCPDKPNQKRKNIDNLDKDSSINEPKHKKANSETSANANASNAKNNRITKGEMY